MYSHDGRCSCCRLPETATRSSGTPPGARLRFTANNGEFWGAGFAADDETVYTTGGGVRAWDVTGDAGCSPAGAASRVVERLRPHPPGPDGHTIARDG